MQRLLPNALFIFLLIFLFSLSPLLLFTDAARFIVGVRGSRKLKVGDYSFTKNKECTDKTYWSCARAGMHRCKARVVTFMHKSGELTYILRNATHNHDPF